MIDTAALIEQVSTLVQPWSDLYSNSATLSTAVLTAHILGMFVGGGMAIAADRAILRSKPGTADAVRAVVMDLSTTHSVVISALALTMLTGVALLASDVGTFAVSRVFWIKMGAFAILLINGLRMQRAEKAVMTSLDGAPIRTAEMPVPFPKQEWSGIHSSAFVSLGLWLLIVVLGVVLTNG
jgi:uncharacterized membrane protein